MSLVKNGLVLTFARLTNYVMMLVTPLFLVRMLDVETYGQYREFLLYATVLAMFFGLAIKDNLIYTIPRHPKRADVATSQTAAMLLVTTTVGLSIFVLGSPWFMSRASFDFLLPLALYIFFFLNFDILENYWLARQQPRLVLIYTSTRTLIRVLVVLGATYFLRDLSSILWAIVAFEACKFGVCITVLVRLRALVPRIDREVLGEQLRFIVPLSAAGLLYFVNEKAGHLYISTALGATALAIYTIGTYQLPITAIVRSAVADTLFPEMVRYAAAGSRKGLELWKDATLYYCLLVFPVFAVLFVFAEQFIHTLFTEAYTEAVGIFRIALIVMVRQCFEMGTPLRAINSNKPLLWGNALAIFFHLPLLVLLTGMVGIQGAAFAWLTADLVLTLFLAKTIMSRYELPLREFSRWRAIGKLVLATAAASPVLLAANHWSPGGLWLEALAGMLFLAFYVALVRIMGITQVDEVIRNFKAYLAQKLNRAPKAT